MILSIICVSFTTIRSVFAEKFDSKMCDRTLVIVYCDGSDVMNCELVTQCFHMCRNFHIVSKNHDLCRNIFRCVEMWKSVEK
jgi:hypothetical protein